MFTCASIKMDNLFYNFVIHPISKNNKEQMSFNVSTQNEFIKKYLFAAVDSFIINNSAI